MVKSVLKVLYIAFGLIIAVLVYIIGYNSNGYSYIEKLTNDAIAKNDYTEVAMIHGGCFDKRSLVVDDSDALDLAIFPSTTLTSITYYPTEDSVTDNSYDNSYYIYIFNPTFETMDVQTTEYLNYTGVRFTAEDGTSYDYKFKISADINSKSYVEKPTTKEKAILNGGRDLFSNYTNWNFFNLTLTSSMIDAMGLTNITSLTLLNSSGKEVYSIDVNLDFSQEFFQDVAPLVEHYNTYIQEVNSDDKNVSKAAADKFDDFYLSKDGQKGFEESFKENENYTFRHPDKYLRPSKLVWKTIGIVVLYLVVAFLLYMLLFHFNFLKSLISREGRLKKNPGASRKNNTIKAKVKDVQPAEEPVVEQTLDSPVIEVKKEE